MVTLRPTGNCIKLQKLYGASNMMQCNRAFFLSTLFKNIYKVYLKSGSIKLQIYTGINNNLSVLPLRTTSKDCTILPRSLNNSSTQRSIWSAGAFFTSNKKNYSASLLVFFQDALNFWRVFSSFFMVKISVTVLRSRPRVYPVLVLVLEHTCNMGVNTSTFLYLK